MTFTTIQRAKAIYSTTIEVFDWHKTSECVTPYELAFRQLEGCDVAGTVCIPGAGVGTYVLAAIEAGFEPAKIYAVELDRGYYQLGAAIFDRFGINYVHADFLEWDPQMEFDVVIGNPPYQDSSTESRDKKLWTKFVWKSLELLQDGGTLSFVTPSSLVGRTRLPAKMREVLSTSYSLDWLDHTANKFFPNVGVDICAWSVSKKTYTGETKVIDPDDERTVDIREELPIPSALKVSDDLAEKIYGQIGLDGVPELKRDYNDVDQTPCEGGKYLNYISGRNKKFLTNDVCKNTGKLKVVFSFSATYKQWFITDANVSGTNVYVCVDSVEEGLEIGNTLMHPLMVFYIDNWRRTAGFCPAIKNNGALPDIRGLGEEEVYKKFNLTEDEIAYIKSGYSEYKSLDRVLMQ